MPTLYDHIIISALAPILNFSSFSLEVAASEQFAVDRYVRVSTVPTASQKNPLNTIVTVTFPKGKVDTVGNAARYLLGRSGYQLAKGDSVSNANHKRLLNFPLPEVQRQFELVTVIAVLDALGGPSYKPRVNHENRTVTYQRRDEVAKKVRRDRSGSLKSLSQPSNATENKKRRVTQQEM